jgi:hypothetical protein
MPSAFRFEREFGQPIVRLEIPVHFACGIRGHSEATN